MVEDDPSDDNYVDGKIYTLTIPLVKPGGTSDNILSYQFYAKSGSDTVEFPADPDPDPTVAIYNNRPVLSWTGEEYYYESDGVHPNTGGDGSTYTFRITYTDQDDDGPDVIQVWVDLNDDGDYEDTGEQQGMTVDGGNGDYTDGEIYSTSISISYPADPTDGQLSYRF